MFCYLQDLTKAVEIYKKAADREVKGNQLQLKKAQNNLRDLQDAYNELFLKYKVYFFLGCVINLEILIISPIRS